MTALFLVLIASLLVAGVFLGGFIWSVKRDQFEDQKGSAMRMLYEDAPLTNVPEFQVNQPSSSINNK